MILILVGLEKSKVLHMEDFRDLFESEEVYQRIKEMEKQGDEDE